MKTLSEDKFSAYVGIDWADSKHDSFPQTQSGRISHEVACYNQGMIWVVTYFLFCPGEVGPWEPDRNEYNTYREAALFEDILYELYYEEGDYCKIKQIEVRQEKGTLPRE